MSTRKIKSLDNAEIETGRTMSRRSMALLGGAAAGSLAALGLVSTTGCCFGGIPRAGGGCSDQDPTDGIGRGTHCVSTGCSDQDPTDPAGGGRTCGGTPIAPGAGTPATPGARTCSDRDPSDPAGRGTHC